MECLCVRWSLGQTEFTSHMIASETFLDVLGADFVCGHISNTTVLQMCVLQNNESVVKPQENPSIHPSVILPRLIESILNHWVRSRDTSLHQCSCFYSFPFFAIWLFGAKRLHNIYTQLNSLHMQCVCVFITQILSLPTWIKHTREIFILAVRQYTEVGWRPYPAASCI